MEQDAITAIPDEEIGTSYFKEPVAQYLYKAWLEDKTDNRILEYSFPLIQSLMVLNINMLRQTKLEPCEIFNILCMGVLRCLESYALNKGKLYTWITYNTRCRMLDLKRDFEKNSQFELLPLIDELDILTDDEATHKLEDFKEFLLKLKEVEGKTANRMIDALYLTLISPSVNASLSQEFIIKQIVKITRLDIILVKPYYERILDRYRHSVLD